MTLLKIARMGHPVLGRIAEPIDDPKAPEISQLISDMIDTLADASGAGLAAPQVHVLLRLVMFHVPQARAEEEDGDGAEGRESGAEFVFVALPFESANDLQSLIAHRLRQHPCQQAIKVPPLPILFGNGELTGFFVVRRRICPLWNVFFIPPHGMGRLHLVSPLLLPLQVLSARWGVLPIRRLVYW